MSYVTQEEFQAVLDNLALVLGQLGTRLDAGTWGTPSNYSVVVRQDQPEGSGSSEYKLETLQLAANTLMARLGGDIENVELDDIVSYGASEPGTPIASAIWYDTGTQELKQYDGSQ